MRMSEKDFANFLSKSNCKILNPLSPIKKEPKHRNTKMYLHENGAVLPQKDINFGKIVEVFDSKKEYARYVELKMLERAKKISDLQTHVSMIIQEACKNDNGIIREIVYKADFKYFDCASKQEIVEDVKAFDIVKQKFLTTKDFNIKWKLLKCKYPDIKFLLY